MTTYSVCRSFPCRSDFSDKAAAVMWMFGLTKKRLAASAVEYKCTVRIRPGDIVYITGPSGSGKTVLLKELAEAIPFEERISLGDIELGADKRVIDCIDAACVESLRILSVAGLNDVPCVLNQPANLSEGQQYRFRLAMALASGKKYIFADEFCVNLDRISAAVISYKIRRFASRTGTCFILAAAHEDVLADLCPEAIVTCELSGKTKVIYREQLDRGVA